MTAITRCLLLAALLLTAACEVGDPPTARLVCDKPIPGVDVYTEVVCDDDAPGSPCAEVTYGPPEGCVSWHLECGAPDGEWWWCGAGEVVYPPADQD